MPAVKFFWFSLVLLAGFSSKAEENNPLFRSIDPKLSNVKFCNTIQETDSFNYFFYDNIYNGAGAGIGDINNDGLPDLYFASNKGNDQLYLNLGGLKFKNITKKAIPKGNTGGWHTGVSFADVNADGWLDIYVCRHGLGQSSTINFPNLLYINNGDLTFTEKAAEYGIADPGRSMDADFFDYDQDGDLDLLVSNHRENISVMDIYRRKPYVELLLPNRLYRNDDGKFTEVTKAAGLLSYGFCLSSSISDLNGDGWPDIYIGSDYAEPDFVFINQQNGKFKSEARDRLRHTSHYSMGVDIADFNNDGAMDICVLDMSNKDYVKSKTNMGSMSVGTFLDNVAKGYNYQYMYNTLQMNLGTGYFAEIAHMAGIASTDWSWSPLLVDFDLDGWKDLYANNGYYRDVRDKDFTTALKDYMASKPAQFDFKTMLAKIPQTQEVDYVFKNNGDLTFTDKSAEWGLTVGSNSNGSAYGDLDNDGDMDVVTNNINETATILENTTTGKNYIKIKLEGPEKNPLAYGAKVTVRTTSGEQVQEVNPSRGYASSSDAVLTFAIGEPQSAYSVMVEWNRLEQTNMLADKKNELYTIRYSDKPNQNASTLYPFIKKPDPTFAKIIEPEYDDYIDEVLLPHKMSQLGPFLSTAYIHKVLSHSAEVDDYFADLFIGGGKGQPGRIYAQVSENNFELTQQPALIADSIYEEAGSVFLDIDNDGDEDLYVVSGGNEFKAQSNRYQDRLYLNNGKGEFTRATDALPAETSSGQCVLVNNANRDGYLDLLVPGRQVPGKYLNHPESLWLVNDNGKFTNKIDEIAPELNYLGMVTDGAFFDFDGDMDDDLVVTGEWMTPVFFENTNGKFTIRKMLENEDAMYGWWNCLELLDINNDGVNEIMLGNTGLNNKFHPTPEFPFGAELADFDNNGTLDLVLTKYFGGIIHPVRGRQCLSEQMPEIADRFKTYADFAQTPFSVIFEEPAQKEKVTNFSNGYLQLENGKYKFHPFENFGQIGCINAIVPLAMNGDEFIDFIAFGNKYEAEIETPRYDANPGLVFLNENGKGFRVIPLEDFGPYINRNAKDAVLIGNSVFVANSGESVDRYELW
jgi:enediyne biosynthesis protein E4